MTLAQTPGAASRRCRRHAAASRRPCLASASMFSEARTRKRSLTRMKPTRQHRIHGLGYRFDETGAMPALEWATIFRPYDEQGKPIAPEQLPLMIALTRRQPARSTFWIKGMDGRERHIEVMAIPLVGQAARFLGAMALFWEV